MGWFRIADGHLRYRGPTRQPFAAWLDTPPGAAAVVGARRGIGFSPLGRNRAARRLLWRQLQATAADERVHSLVDKQARTYHTLLASLAFLEPLPRTTVDLRRVVAVPRLLLNGRAHQSMHEGLATLVGRNGPDYGDLLFDFLAMTLVDQMDRAFASARPAARRPLSANEEWASVGVDLHLIWDAPDWEGPMWPGHHYVYEQPRNGLSRRQRKRVEAAVREMDASIRGWAPSRRHDTLQRAAASLGV